MAAEVREFAVTVATGSSAAAPVTTALAMPARIVREVRVRTPPGPRGEVGWALAAAGVAILPWGAGQWMVTDDEEIDWPLTDQIDSGAWQLIAYNTGLFAHTLYLTFLLDLVGGGPGVTLSPAVPLLSADAIAGTSPVATGSIPPVATGSGVYVPPSPYVPPAIAPYVPPAIAPYVPPAIAPYVPPAAPPAAPVPPPPDGPALYAAAQQAIATDPLDPAAAAALIAGETAVPNLNWGTLSAQLVYAQRIYPLITTAIALSARYLPALDAAGLTTYQVEGGVPVPQADLQAALTALRSNGVGIMTPWDLAPMTDAQVHALVAATTIRYRLGRT